MTSTNGIEWRPVPGYEGLYSVSNTGLVRSDRKNPTMILRPWATRKGYQTFTLRKDGKQRTRCGHAMILAAFAGPRPKGAHVNHINGKRNDNRLSNLEYCTPRENVLHSLHVLKTHAIGERNGQSKLTAAKVVDIRRLHAEGKSIRAISREFGVSRPNIDHILARRYWGHI